jgi:hypothetical protein
MRILAVCLLAFFASAAYAAVSLEDIVKLSKANTSDEVILQLIQKEGLAKPVTSKEIVYLKQQGVSDRVIQYLMKVSAAEKSESSQENMRSYYTTTKSGKRILIVTNLDENGKRMGGEIPPDPAPAQAPEVVYERQPQEIRVVVENDSRYEDRYPVEYPEYVDDRYVMPGYPSYYPYPEAYVPYYPLIPNHHGRRGDHFPKDPNRAHWRVDYSKNRPLIQPRHRQTGSKPASKSSPAKSFRSIKQ